MILFGVQYEISLSIDANKIHESLPFIVMIVPKFTGMEGNVLGPIGGLINLSKLWYRKMERLGIWENIL